MLFLIALMSPSIRAQGLGTIHGSVKDPSEFSALGTSLAQPALEKAIELTRPGGKTALIDTVYLGLSRMREARRPRRALLILSDGMDNQSRYSKGELMRVALEADVVVRYRIRDAAEWAFYGPTPDDVLRVEVTTAMVRSLGEMAVDAGADKVVIKAQVLVGGRGKAGGVKLAGFAEQAELVAQSILDLEIKGIPVRKVLVGPAADDRGTPSR
jgi:hypothetical protein